jgi:hypothetical protein
MTNMALFLLKDKCVNGLRPRNDVDDIIMQFHDPNVLSYTHNGVTVTRKPDNVFIKLETARVLHGDKLSWIEIAQNYSSSSFKKEKAHHVGWGNVLCPSELKRDSPGTTSRQANKLEETSFEEILIKEGLRPGMCCSLSQQVCSKHFLIRENKTRQQ